MVKINNSLINDTVKIFITTWQVKFSGKKIIKVSLLFNSYSFWISLLNLSMADEHLATFTIIYSNNACQNMGFIKYNLKNKSICM